jgi:hypothetical protein
MIPLLVVLLVTGLLLLATGGLSYVAPFVYSIFSDRDRSRVPAGALRRGTEGRRSKSGWDHAGACLQVPSRRA